METVLSASQVNKLQMTVSNCIDIKRVSHFRQINHITSIWLLIMHSFV